MAVDRDFNLSSLFDAMLEKDRARLERLYGGTPPESDRPAVTAVQPPSNPPAPKRETGRPARAEARNAPPMASAELRGSADGVPFSIRPRA